MAESTPGLPVVLDTNGNPIMDSNMGNMSIKQLDEFEEGSESSEPKVKRVGRFATFLNLCNAMVGAGIVSVPSTFNATGLGPTTILLALCGFLCFYSGVIMLGLQSDHKVSGLNELAYKIFGNSGQLLVSICIIIFAFSCTVAYLIIGANQIKSWLTLAGYNMTGKTEWALLMTFYLVVLPGMMTIPRHLDCLSKLAIPSVAGVAFYFFVMIIKAFTLLPKPEYPDPTTIGYKMSFEIFTAFGVHSLTFSLPVIMLPIIAPYNPSVRKRVYVMGWTFIATWLIVSIPAAIGYLLFGQNTKSDVLSSFPDNDILILIVRVGMFISVSMSYPAIVMSITGSLGQMLYQQNNPELLTSKQRWVLIPLVNIANLVVAIFFPDIRSILGVGGSIGGCLVGFVFPSLCRIVTRNTSLSTLTNVGHICFIVFGIIMSIICTYSSVKDAISSMKK